MLIKLNTKIGHILMQARLMLEKIYRAVLNIFAKALKYKNYYKIISPVNLEKQFVLEIANTSFNKTFEA